MKHEWKKHERELYGVKNKPEVITVRCQNFIMINGEGNPNYDDFQQRVGVLFSLAHPIKFRFKAMCNTGEEPGSLFEYSDYSVYPLEGVWSTANPDNPLDKDCFQYTIMIRQPDYITKEMFNSALAVVEKKKPHPFLKDVLFETVEEGKCIQMLHLGSFDNEPESFARMEMFAKENGFERLSPCHREIYLNDARKTKPENKKTILRFQVK